MAETCIVCLGDLARLDDDPTALATSPPGHDADADQDHVNIRKGASQATTDDDMVARLLPCGHNMHNECLKPWVERANSCPICRAQFHSVELSARVGGMSAHGSSMPDAAVAMLLPGSGPATG
jgi:hypothetical protein